MIGLALGSPPSFWTTTGFLRSVNTWSMFFSLLVLLELGWRVERWERQRTGRSMMLLAHDQ